MCSEAGWVARVVDKKKLPHKIGIWFGLKHQVKMYWVILEKEVVLDMLHYWRLLIRGIPRNRNFES
jgi:hypothetical protein